MLGGTLIDCTGAPSVEGSAVVIESGRITKLGRAGEVEIPAGCKILDASGCWVTPGLIDCHMHLAGETTSDAFRRYLDPPRDVRLLRAARDTLTLLNAGFTTLRQVGLGWGVALRRAIESGVIEGPRILAANTTITSTGGHGDWTVFPYEWVKSMPPEYRGTIADGVDECRLAVRRSLRAGADLIKVMVSGGGVTNHAGDLAAHLDYTPAELAAIVDEAHRRGARVAAHVVGESSIRAAIDANVNTIEHGVFEPDQSLLARMAEKGISLVPTLLIFRWVVEEGRQAGVFAGGVAAAEEWLERQFRMIASAKQAGVNIALGTDNNGVIDCRTHARELSLLCEAGLTASEALECGTRNAAIACGLEDQIGTVETGKSADILVLEENPLADIGSLQREGVIRWVIQGTTERQRSSTQAPADSEVPSRASPRRASDLVGVSTPRALR